MSEIQVIEEVPLTLIDLKEKLETIKKSRELSFRGNKTLGYLQQFVKTSKKDAEELRKKLNGLEILRLKDKHITKIIDIHPEDQESLKVILSGDNVTVKQEDMKKVLECLK